MNDSEKIYYLFKYMNKQKGLSTLIPLYVEYLHNSSLKDIEVGIYFKSDSWRESFDEIFFNNVIYDRKVSIRQMELIKTTFIYDKAAEYIFRLAFMLCDVNLASFIWKNFKALPPPYIVDENNVFKGEQPLDDIIKFIDFYIDLNSNYLFQFIEQAILYSDSKIFIQLMNKYNIEPNNKSYFYNELQFYNFLKKIIQRVVTQGIDKSIMLEAILKHFVNRNWFDTVLEIILNFDDIMVVKVIIKDNIYLILGNIKKKTNVNKLLDKGYITQELATKLISSLI